MTRPRIPVPPLPLPQGVSADRIRRLVTGNQVAAQNATADAAEAGVRAARGDLAKQAVAIDEASAKTSQFNNELLFLRGLEELEKNPQKAARLQAMNQSFLQTPWVHVPDFADSLDGGPARQYRGVMMTRVTPRQAMGMAWGDRSKGIADRLMERNAVNQDAPFPIIRSAGNHLDQPIFAFQNMANEFPEHRGAIGLYRPGSRYATWNAQYADGLVPLHEVVGHGLMDGGAAPNPSQQMMRLADGTQVPVPWEEDILRLGRRAYKKLDRVNEHFLGPDDIGIVHKRHPDAVNHEVLLQRLIGDPSELRAIGFTMKHDAADIFGVNPVSRADSDQLLNLLLDQGYRKYDVGQPTFRQGPRTGQERPYFNEEQRGLKTYYEKLSPGDQEIFRELWHKFGKTDGGATSGMA